MFDSFDLFRRNTAPFMACNGNSCCGHVAPIQPDLYYALWRLTRLFPHFSITSGFRCRTHNLAVGGQDGSFHMLGMAVDLTPTPAHTPGDIRSAALRIHMFAGGGIIYHVDNGSVHLDIRADGAYAFGW